MRRSLAALAASPPGLAVDTSEAEVVGTCRECGVPMVSNRSWKRGRRPAGHSEHGSRGLCRLHYIRLVRTGTTGLLPKRGNGGGAGRRLDEVLEEYAMIRDSCSTVAEAADRMGMTFSALDRALYRARQAGRTGALPPLQQLERAIHGGAYKGLREAS